MTEPVSERDLTGYVRDLGGRLTPDQEAWLEALRGVPSVEVNVWRPSDMYEIAEVLR